jgi:hypothetical protein
VYDNWNLFYPKNPKCNIDKLQHGWNNKLITLSCASILLFNMKKYAPNLGAYFTQHPCGNQPYNGW